MIRPVHASKLIGNICAVHVHVVIFNEIEAEELNETFVLVGGTPNLFLLHNPLNCLRRR